MSAGWRGDVDRHSGGRVAPLNALQTAPASRTVTFAPGKNAGEVALVDKAAGLRNIRELQPGSCKSSLARSTRRLVSHRCGEMPVACLNARAK